MYTANDGCGVDLFKYLSLCMAVCLRLEAWAQQPQSSSLVLFAQEIIKNLVAKTRRFEQDVRYEVQTASTESSESTKGTFSVKLLDSIRGIGKCTTLATGILDYCTHYEGSGEEDALNTLFFVLGGRSLNPHNIPHQRRLERELKQSLSSRFSGIIDLMQDYALGSGVTESSQLLPVTATIWKSIYDDATKIPRRLQPRYVHTYATRQGTPYAVDNSASLCPGSLATVKKVHHKGSKEAFAEKTYKNIFSAKERKAVLNELGILELCDHPNIITLVEAYEVEDEPHIINLVISPWAPLTLQTFLYMPDSERKDSCSWFQLQELSSDRYIYRIMSELATAVGYLHELSIKHKDIKPDNILLYLDGDRATPYITDFGVSKVFWLGAATNYDQSTYPFLSLEQLEHQESSPKADVWQLGCCFAMLLALMRGGQDGVLKLHVSYQRTDEKCTCNIAKELGWFMRTLDGLCMSASVAQKHLLWTVRRMLDLNPQSRLDIQMVRRELEVLLE